MITRSPLLWICLSLDAVGAVLAAWLAAQVLDASGLVFGLLLLLLAWFFGGYSFLRWPWMTFRQLLQRWWLVLVSAIALMLLAGLLLNAPVTAVWFHPNTLLSFGLAFGLWGALIRCWLHPLARRQAALASGRSPLFRMDESKAQVSATPQRQLLLLLVAYHPSLLEVQQLQACLLELPPELGYAVVVNDHQPGEPVDQLAAGADLFLANPDNPGYGRAVNRLVEQLHQLPSHIGVLNTDLSWQPGSFERMLAWMQQHPDVNLAVPQILDEDGNPQKLCKHHPTVLGLFSRRFLPPRLKPGWLKRYDRWYVMADQNYQEVFEAPYLSGCCMVIRSDAFRRAGGFDERYFLYLEDADLTRSLALDGRCVHLPVASVVHGWGRGNYRNLRLMAVNLVSAWHYFRKWGWALW